jgi:hypothetical protein
MLLAVVVLLSLPLSWFASKMRYADRQRTAVEAIIEAGFCVRYDFQPDNPLLGFASEPSEPPVLPWPKNLLGTDFFCDVVAAHYCARAGNGVMPWKEFKELPTLERLDLSGSEVTDSELKHLNEFTELTDLSLGCTWVTDNGLGHLDGLSNLRNLNLDSTRVTDDGLEHLKRLTNLRRLCLYGTRVTDTGLLHVKEMVNLESLNLGDTGITDAGLEHLKGLTRCRRLALENTNITDDGVSRIRKALLGCSVVRGHGRHYPHP